MNMTQHARTRCQQRAIPPLIIDWLCRYGTRIRGYNGTTICVFDKASRRLLASEVGLPVVRRLADWMDSYLVLSGDSVITVGHRYRPLRHRHGN